MKSLWIPTLQLVAAAVLLFSCSKSNNSPFAQYASKMSRARHWSGTASSKYPNLSHWSVDSPYIFSSAPVPDTTAAVQITGSNTIKMMGSTLTYDSRDGAQHYLFFTYHDWQSENYAELYYYYDADTMIFSSGWAHHEFYNGCTIHSD